MRQVLYFEKKKERCNAIALGMENAAASIEISSNKFSELNLNIGNFVQIGNEELKIKGFDKNRYGENIMILSDGRSVSENLIFNLKGYEKSKIVSKKSEKYIPKESDYTNFQKSISRKPENDLIKEINRLESRRDKYSTTFRKQLSTNVSPGLARTAHARNNSEGNNEMIKDYKKALEYKKLFK